MVSLTILVGEAFEYSATMPETKIAGCGPG